MPDLVYHVAITLDGYIARHDGSASGFTHAGPHVDAYQEQLSLYGAIVMGRATYEIGYVYGMKQGDKPFGERPHFVFSETLELPATTNLTIVRGDTLAAIDQIKAQADAPVYLCGGGKFAGYLLANGKIDGLRLKVSPLIYGDGIKLFEKFDGLRDFALVDATPYESGVVLLEYKSIQ